jgi:AcrR family transcriptional regulator
MAKPPPRNAERRDSRRTRDTYRHGNLKEAAIQAALGLVSARGAEALTLRGVAEMVGVAHRSLYNHFADREALVDAVAEAGFDALAAALRAATTRAEFTQIYVRFVLDHRSLYAIMKSQPVAILNQKPELRRAIHLTAQEAVRLFGDPSASAEHNRRVITKVLILLYGGISMYL